MRVLLTRVYRAQFWISGSWYCCGFHSVSRCIRRPHSLSTDVGCYDVYCIHLVFSDVSSPLHTALHVTIRLTFQAPRTCCTVETDDATYWVTGLKKSDAQHVIILCSMYLRHQNSIRGILPTSLRGTAVYQTRFSVSFWTTSWLAGSDNAPIFSARSVSARKRSARYRIPTASLQRCTKPDYIILLDSTEKNRGCSEKNLKMHTCMEIEGDRVYSWGHRTCLSTDLSPVSTSRVNVNSGSGNRALPNGSAFIVYM